MKDIDKEIESFWEKWNPKHGYIRSQCPVLDDYLIKPKMIADLQELIGNGIKEYLYLHYKDKKIL